MYLWCGKDLCSLKIVLIAYPALQEGPLYHFRFDLQALCKENNLRGGRHGIRYVEKISLGLRVATKADNL